VLEKGYRGNRFPAPRKSVTMFANGKDWVKTDGGGGDDFITLIKRRESSQTPEVNAVHKHAAESENWVKQWLDLFARRG